MVVKSRNCQRRATTHAGTYSIVQNQYIINFPNFYPTGVLVEIRYANVLRQCQPSATEPHWTIATKNMLQINFFICIDFCTLTQARPITV